MPTAEKAQAIEQAKEWYSRAAGVVFTDYRGLKVKESQGKIKAPEVAASVIYADEISANTVVADTIYVRELKRSFDTVDDGLEQRAGAHRATGGDTLYASGMPLFPIPSTYGTVSRGRSVAAELTV